MEMKLKFNIEFFTKWGEELYVELDRSYPLEYKEKGIWSGEIRINDAKEQRIVEYRYFVKNSNGEIFYEAGKRRAIAINSSTSAIEAFDSWCPNSDLAPLLTAPFSDVLYKNNSSQYTYTHKNNYEIIIRVIAPKIGAGSRLLLCGATAELGEWDPSKAKEMKRVNGERWEYSMMVQMPHPHSSNSYWRQREQRERATNGRVVKTGKFLFQTTSGTKV